jgi:hypothetical protein
MSEKVFVHIEGGGTSFRGHYCASRLHKLIDIFIACMNTKPTTPAQIAANALKRIRSLTPEQKAQTFVDAGIIYPNGQVAVEYGGYDIGKEYIVQPLLLP